MRVELANIRLTSQKILMNDTTSVSDTNENVYHAKQYHVKWNE